MTMRLLIFLLLLPLSGCGGWQALKSMVGLGGPPRTELTSLRVIALEGANGNLATRLDLVFVLDAELKARLPKTGPDWFRQKAELLAASPLKLETLSLELPPLAEARHVLTKTQARAVAVLAYADYQAVEGQPVLDLTPLNNASLTLGPGAIRLDAQP